MTATGKILAGAIATVILAVLLHGPGGFGARCAELSSAMAAFAGRSMEIEEEAKRVEACQQTVDNSVAMRRVEFTDRTTTIAAASDAMLDQVAIAFRSCSDVMLEIGGHTDRTGDPGSNMTLSIGRANAVLAALAARGVATSQMTSEGYGQTQPLEPDARMDNPADNRISLKVFGRLAAAKLLQQQDKKDQIK